MWAERKNFLLIAQLHYGSLAPPTSRSRSAHGGFSSVFRFAHAAITCSGAWNCFGPSWIDTNEVEQTLLQYRTRACDRTSLSHAMFMATFVHCLHASKTSAHDTWADPLHFIIYTLDPSPIVFSPKSPPLALPFCRLSPRLFHLLSSLCRFFLFIFQMQTIFLIFGMSCIYIFLCRIHMEAHKMWNVFLNFHSLYGVYSHCVMNYITIE